MFLDFDPNILNDPDFKEDSVREVIIVPILNRLGYESSGDYKIYRSKPLKHPYVYIGTTKHNVTIIPDYTLMHNGKCLIVIDAKAPNQNILDGKNVQQAYSYATHPEIKCQNFALCNGRLLSVFDILENKPLFVEKLENFDKNWGEVERHLGHKFLLNPVLRGFAPDFGTNFARLGFTKETKLTMLGCQLNVFGRLNEELMTATANCQFAEQMYCISIDFHPRFFPKMLSGLPADLAMRFNDALARAPFQAAAELRIELDLDLKLGSAVELETETFIPFVVTNVLSSRFNHTPLAGESANVPK